MPLQKKVYSARNKFTGGAGKAKFPTKLFIVAALGNFILLFLFFLILKSAFSVSWDNNGQTAASRRGGYGDGDPLITRASGLRDVLDGPIINGLDPSLGPNEAAVTIVYFADYECGYCQEQEAVIKKIMEKYEDKIRLIWKDYPEKDSGANSFSAAAAGRCAQEQGRFWAFHDQLFQNGDKLGGDLFLDLAEKLNLRKSLFSECLEDEETARLVRNNILEAEILDIKGVPFIFVNKEEIMGEATEEDLETIIKAELDKL
ncbi:MAG: DsbA family protein [Patescibacteria group bacterium]|nr:DsbA family protein [Patescibacteria group bacterium]